LIYALPVLGKNEADMPEGGLFWSVCSKDGAKLFKQETINLATTDGNNPKFVVAQSTDSRQLTVTARIAYQLFATNACLYVARTTGNAPHFETEPVHKNLPGVYRLTGVIPEGSVSNTGNLFIGPAPSLKYGGTTMRLGPFGLIPAENAGVLRVPDVQNMLSLVNTQTPVIQTRIGLTALIEVMIRMMHTHRR
jgi:hypothetical protein